MNCAEKRLWQLPNDKIVKAVNDALTHTLGEYAPCIVKPSTYDIAVARAAERHMVRWLAQHDMASRRIFNNNTDNEANVLLEKGDLWVDRLDWEAPQAAAEEVRG